MKRRIAHILGLALMAVSCDSMSGEQPVIYGEISVAVGADAEVISKASTPLLPTDEAAADYMVRIFDSSDNLCEGCEGSYSSFGAKKLEMGTYTVKVEDCSEAEAESGNGRMRIAGSSAVTLDANNLSKTATVNCTVRNAKVTVKFDSSVEGRFTDLSVVLTGGTTSRGSVTVSLAEGSREVWFNPSDLTYTISGTFNAGGIEDKPVSFGGNRTLEARDNIEIVVKVNLENGLLVPAITIDNTIKDPVQLPGEFNPYQ